MSLTWEEVSLVHQSFEDTIQPFYVGGGLFWITTGTGMKTYRARASEPTTPDAALDADDGTTAVAQAGDSYSVTRTRAVPTNRKSDHINGSPRDFEIVVTFRDPTGGDPIGAMSAGHFVFVQMENGEPKIYYADEQNTMTTCSNAADGGTL